MCVCVCVFFLAVLGFVFVLFLFALFCLGFPVLCFVSVLAFLGERGCCILLFFRLFFFVWGFFP